MQRYRRFLNGKQIETGIETGQFLGALVYENYILILSGQKFGQVYTYISGSRNYNFHLSGFSDSEVSSTSVLMIASQSI